MCKLRRSRRVMGVGEEGYEVHTKALNVDKAGEQGLP
jgi:hypothetical protein